MSFGKTFYIGKSVRVFPRKIAYAVITLFVIYYFLSYFENGLNARTHNQNMRSNIDEVLQFSHKAISRLALKEFGVEEYNETIIANTSKEFKIILSSFVKSMQRIEDLEKKVRDLENELHAKNAVGIVSEPKKEWEVDSTGCVIPSLEGNSVCLSKLEWMRARWKSDGCYAEWGVDGSDCSIIRYLSEVEQWCPKLESSTIDINVTVSTKSYPPLTLRTDFSQLYDILHNDAYFKWIRMRILRMEHKWLEAGNQLSNNFNISKWRKQKILVHASLLSEENGWKIAENAFSGGPLGELVQWSDLIASLYILGHDITVTVTSDELGRTLKSFIDSTKSDNCPIKEKLFDIVYIDIGGLRKFKAVAKQKFHLFHCDFRVVDTFGTEPMYNYPTYARRHNKKSEWGLWDLMPKQFNTMLPHTPDNTFLGFVIEQGNFTRNNQKDNSALVYGKRDLFWKNKGHYIDALHEVLPLHATVNNDNLQHVPPYVINHGVLPGEKFHNLLDSTKIFVGMGFPYEGPAPLEAIASGLVFLNPVFKKDSPMYIKARSFFEKKPTDRIMSSQHPYAEVFVGPPHVQMVNIQDVEEVKRIVKKILTGPEVKPHLPADFTCYGMLQRVGFLVEKQEFCSESSSSWPPASALQIVVTDAETTCGDACMQQSLICEPDFFPLINKRLIFKTLGVACENYETPGGEQEEIDYPSFRDASCYLQGNKKLFSCTGRRTNTRHICPCRDYVKGQIAFCQNCFTA